MTENEFLEIVLNRYEHSKDYESDIAKRYNANKTDVSQLLQLCGFSYGKRTNTAISDIDTLLKNKKINHLCKKILANSPQKSQP